MTLSYSLDLRQGRAWIAGITVISALSICCVGAAARAQAADAPPAINLAPGETQAEAVAATPAPTVSSEETGVDAYFTNWFRRVAKAQSEQPSWLALLNTPPPFLVEQLRYDQYIEHLGNDASVRSFGVNKGIQLIPTGTEEVDITIPAYMERENRTPATGFSDWQFALFKQRLFSAGPRNGNYVASAWLSATAPTGSSKFTNHVYFLSPNIGGGKGWGNFDVQATFGASIPTSRSHLYGTSLIGNLAFQYRFEKVIWPEVEFNWTEWLNGTQRGGKNQLFMTVGAILGKFKIRDRLGVVIGAGYQFPLAPSYRATPAILPAYSRNWVATLRMPF